MTLSAKDRRAAARRLAKAFKRQDRATRELAAATKETNAAFKAWQPPRNTTQAVARAMLTDVGMLGDEA